MTRNERIPPSLAAKVDVSGEGGEPAPAVRAVPPPSISEPVLDPAALGPLAPLIGEWEGDRGYDDAYVYARGREECAQFRERSSFSPAGPAHNGAQVVYRLDYKTTAWRMDEEMPLHTEIGYWFRDAGHELVMRAVITPRGIVVLAGGSAGPSDTTIAVRADAGAEDFGVSSNPHPGTTARTTQFRMAIDLSKPDEFFYEQETFMYQTRIQGIYCHRDTNTLNRVRT